MDVDGAGFAGLGERDPVVSTLQNRFPGLRPVLFFTPYEAAAWATVGHRIRMTQAAAVKQRLAAELGEHGAFPAPDRLAELDGLQRGLTERKVEQLRVLGAATVDGQLSRDRLRAMTREDALGTFSACLASAPSPPSSSSSAEPAIPMRYRSTSSASPAPPAPPTPPRRRRHRAGCRTLAALPRLGRAAPPQLARSADRRDRRRRPTNGVNAELGTPVLLKDGHRHTELAARPPIGLIMLHVEGLPRAPQHAFDGWVGRAREWCST